MSIQTTTKLRVARPTDDLEAVAKFYREGLGFTELYRFADHDGFDGVMLGLPDASYHLEFTRAHGHRAGRAPAADNLLVFYLPDQAQWHEAVARVRRPGDEPVPTLKTYWDRLGVTFEDPDGYRVVLQRDAWEH
jgi:catechol 2,3-dioxygenase-like lactoylglutathione lyase family enzyme